ncbi:MAG: hypothetical protein HKN12_06020, partial [Gemmatimonadetes bacterium]|nr:hypothetical protein [Gemmatimonadota bacterium]
GRVIEAFEEVLKGAAPGDTRDAEIPYPEDYEDKELAGTTAKYRITVQKVQEKRYPTLDDALVKEHTESENLEEFKEYVRKNLGDQADRAGVERLEQILIDKVVDANPFDPPGTLVEHLLEDLINRQKYELAQAGGDPESVNPEEVRTQARASAERQVCRMLLLDAIANAEEIKTEDKDLGERIAVMAHLHGQPPREFVEKMGGNRFLRQVSREIRDKKVLAFLTENAEITVTKVSAQPSETT